MFTPILKPLNSLSCWDRFVIHQEGFTLADYWRSEVFEKLSELEVLKELKYIRCFTTNNVVNSAFFLQSNLLVFPVEENRTAQILHTQKIISDYEKKFSESVIFFKGVPLGSLNLSERFFLSPAHKNKYIIMHEVNETSYWVCSNWGDGKILSKSTIVYL